MSSPIHLDDNTEPTLAYASPWARERILPVAEPPPRSRPRTRAAAENELGKIQTQVQRGARHAGAATPACR